MDSPRDTGATGGTPAAWGTAGTGRDGTTAPSPCDGRAPRPARASAAGDAGTTVGRSGTAAGATSSREALTGGGGLMTRGAGGACAAGGGAAGAGVTIAGGCTRAGAGGTTAAAEGATTIGLAARAGGAGTTAGNGVRTSSGDWRPSSRRSRPCLSIGACGAFGAPMARAAPDSSAARTAGRFMRDGGGGTSTVPVGAVAFGDGVPAGAGATPLRGAPGTVASGVRCASRRTATGAATGAAAKAVAAICTGSTRSRRSPRPRSSRSSLLRFTSRHWAAAGATGWRVVSTDCGTTVTACGNLRFV